MGGSPTRALKAVATGGVSEVVRPFEKSDTLKAMTGRETSEEKTAKAEQKASLASSQASAAADLEERRKRMELKKQGRGSLLTGSEIGVTPATTSTLG